MSLPTGFEGLVLTGAQAPVTNLPQGFKGIILSFNAIEKFIIIQSNRGVPIVGATVEVQNSVEAPFTATTNQNGFIFGFFDLTGNIPIKVTSGRTFYNFTIDGSNQPISTILKFPTEMVE